MTSAFPDVWRSVAERCPERTAIVSATGETRSYGRVHDEAGNMADRLTAAGVRPGGNVGLRLSGRGDFAVSLLGVWLAGATPVPLPATAPRWYVESLIGGLGGGTIIDDRFMASSGALPDHVSGDPGREPDSTRRAAYVMHTSGSTGRPKPVAVSHEALAGYCAAFASAVELEAADRFLQFAPTSFDVVFEELLPAWTTGAAVVLAPETAPDPQTLLRVVDERQVTIAEVTTVYWRLLTRHLIADGAQPPASLRLLIAGGERADLELIRETLAAGVPLGHVYGVTEAAITSTLKIFGAGDTPTAVTVGSPIANSTVHIVDDSGRPVPDRGIGEVWIGGQGIAEGYRGLPDETRQRFVTVTGTPLPPGRYYRTGDAGRWTDEGELEVLGRLDAEVKVGGVRVDLTEIEEVAAACPAVADAACIAIETPFGRRLCGFATPSDRSGAAMLEREVRGWLQARLPDHAVPSRMVVLNALPVTDHGKIDRRALAGLAQSDTRADELGPLTATERTLVQAWVTVTGTAPEDVDQRFADAGGDSLVLATLTVLLESRGLSVSALDCLTHPTIRSLAQHLDAPARDEDTAAATGERHEQRRRLRMRRRAIEGAHRGDDT